MILVELIGLVALSAALTWFIRDHPVTEGLRVELRGRSRLLSRMLECPHCLSLWIAVAAVALLWWIQGLSYLEVGLFILVGWRGAFYINRAVAQRREHDVRRSSGQTCTLCGRPCQEQTCLEREGLPFCSTTCWFNFLRARPAPRNRLVGRAGELIRQEMYPMSYKDVTPEQAKALLDGGAGHVYVDVRSIPEFQNGHPAGAANVPVMHREAFGMVPNQDFLTVMEAHFGRQTPLLVGCQSGVRSIRAAEALIAAGFTDVANVTGGFGGVRDGMGRVVHKGWFELGLPTDYGDPEGRSYEAIAGGRRKPE